MTTYPYALIGTVSEGDGTSTEYAIGSARTGWAAQRSANRLMRQLPNTTCSVWVPEMEYSATHDRAIFTNDGDEAIRDALEAVSDLFEMFETAKNHLNHLLSTGRIVNAEEKARIARRLLASLRSQMFLLSDKRATTGPELGDFLDRVYAAQEEGIGQ